MPRRKAILLIDDELNMLRLNTRVLEREGYHVLPAQNIRDARALIKGVVFHAAVVDIDLKDGSGLDFCRELREKEDIPIVFLTALKGKEYEKAVYDAGASGFITKPYRIEDLTGTLAALLAAAAEGSTLDSAKCEIL